MGCDHVPFQPGTLNEGFDLESIHQAQRIQHEFERQVGRRNVFSGQRRWSGQVAPGLASLRGSHDGSGARERELAVCSRAHPEIVAEGPVVEVVAAAMPIARVGRDLADALLAAALTVREGARGQVINVGTGKIVSKVDVGDEPEGLAVSAAAGLLGVTSEASNSVTLLSLADSTSTARLAVGQRPRDLAFTPDGKSLFVSGENDASITVIDVSARRVRQTLHLTEPGARPKGVAISPDGARVYVTTGRGSHVDVLDSGSLKIIASIAVGARPWGIGLSPDGRYLYTANGPSNDVSVIDTVSLSVVATVKAGEKPWGLTVVPTG